MPVASTSMVRSLFLLMIIIVVGMLVLSNSLSGNAMTASKYPFSMKYFLADLSNVFHVLPLVITAMPFPFSFKHSTMEALKDQSDETLFVNSTAFSEIF